MIVGNKGRGTRATSISAVLAINLLLVATGAAFIVSCDPFDDVSEIVQYPDSLSEEQVETKVALSAKNVISNVDIFFFNNDRLLRIDSYQRFDGDNIENVSASSQKGAKLMVIIANSQKDKEYWCRISSYYDLASQYSELACESPERPTLVGEKQIITGKDKSASVTLSAVMSVIRLNSISCDFHSRPYKDAMLHGARAYLTNVNIRYPLILQDGVCAVSEILNLGHLSEQDMTSFGHPGLVCANLPEDIGANVVKPGIELFCYPNTSESASIGSAFTRLVIEGSINGVTYYYPIDINRQGMASSDGNGNGVNANTVYSYDITITGRGTLDPDTQAERESITTSFYAKEWENTDTMTIKY